MDGVETSRHMSEDVKAAVAAAAGRELKSAVADGSNAVVLLRSLGTPPFASLTVLSLNSCA